MTYAEFLQNKILTVPKSGFKIYPDEINAALKPHQRDAVMWAVQGGRRALFESFGLGKTVQELEYCRIITERFGGKALIVLPLGVRQEFQRDASKILGMEPPEYVRTMAEARASGTKIVLTNYERVRDGDIDPKEFTAMSLDEASVLRSYGSKTYQTFMEKFQGVPYKLVCTATPSPNKYKELIHYAGYLEIMDTGQALTRFFQRDSTKANNLTLYPHKEDEFWLWVSSWALLITKPSDLGYDDSGYDLPPLDVRYHKIDDDPTKFEIDRDGQFSLKRSAAISLSAAAKEKSGSIDRRVAKAQEIVESSPDDHFILWHDLESERAAIKKAIPQAVDIHGSMEYDLREQRVIDFSDGKIKIFTTKKSLSGSGCNFQRYCHRAVFIGIDYEFNDFLQAIHRIYRFLQPEIVRIDIIYTESEAEILRVLLDKWRRHDEMAEKMTAIIKRYGLSGAAIKENMKRSIGVERIVNEGNHYKAVLNDCIPETASMPENSVGLIHTSIPFSNHYEYTPSYNDLGHNEDTARFFEQMDFLTPELLRVLKPGRIFACHVKDRVLFGNATGTGMPTIEPFTALTLMHCIKHGFQFIGQITVLTDVVRENNQTYRLGYSEQCKDGSKMGVGCPEYILLFRKLPTDTSAAYADEPVKRDKISYSLSRWQLDAHAFWRSSGNRVLTPEDIAQMPINKVQKAFSLMSRGNVYNYDEHVKLARTLEEKGMMSKTFMVVAPPSWSSMVWDDVNRMRTLNTKQSQKQKQMHVCPLQFDIVERIIDRYSNPGDVVYDPFAGLFTVPMIAVKMGRYGVGTELNADYYADGLAYLKAAEEERDMPTLFDFIESSGAVAN